MAIYNKSLKNEKKRKKESLKNDHLSSSESNNLFNKYQRSVPGLSMFTIALFIITM